MRVEDWIRQAVEDLDTARILIEVKKYYASAYYSQQSAEKALKYLLLLHGKDPGKTHALLELSEMIEKEGIEVNEQIKEDLMVLSPHFLISRYPDVANGLPADQYNKNIAEDLYNKAKRVVEWVKRVSQQ